MSAEDDERLIYDYAETNNLARLEDWCFVGTNNKQGCCGCICRNICNAVRSKEWTLGGIDCRTFYGRNHIHNLGAFHPHTSV